MLTIECYTWGLGFVLHFGSHIQFSRPREDHIPLYCTIPKKHDKSLKLKATGAHQLLNTLTPEWVILYEYLHPVRVP